MRRYSETFAVWTLPLALLVAVAGLGLLLTGFSSTVAAWLAAVGVAVVLAVSIQIAAPHGDLPLASWLPAVFPSIHFAAGAGLLCEALQVWRGKNNCFALHQHVARQPYFALT